MRWPRMKSLWKEFLLRLMRLMAVLTILRKVKSRDWEPLVKKRAKRTKLPLKERFPRD